MDTYETTFHLVGLDAEVILVGERVRGVCWVRGNWACVRVRARACARVYAWLHLLRDCSFLPSLHHNGRKHHA